MGNPLCCSLNDITIEDLQSGKYSSLVGVDSSQVGGETPSATQEAMEISTASINATEAATNVVGVGDPGSEDKTSMDEGGVPVKPADVGSELTNKNAPFGGSLSLARVQSLVSMTTPRDGNQGGMLRNPPFVEFDLSIDGFACLFLPSVFPQSIAQVQKCMLVHK